MGARVGRKAPPASKQGGPAPADLAYLLVLALIWGSSFLWIKLSLRGFSPAQNTVLRLCLGAAALRIYSLARRAPLPRGRGVWIHLVAVASFANVIPYFLFALAETEIDSSIAGVLNATTPFWTAGIAASQGMETFNRRRVAGLLVGFGGVLLIFEPWSAGSQVMSLAGLACLAAAACYGVGFVYSARYLTGRGLTSLSLSSGQLMAAAVLGLLLIPAFGWPQVDLRADALLGTLILGVFGTGIAYVIAYRLLANRGASGAALVTYLLPVVAVLLGAVTLAERVRLNVVAGVAVVLLGVGLIRAAPR
ncbi:MAG TPA: DMT family transporter [Actinomycetota bacterium]|nr:DMT family transporter [Actinomycetota bacterium]